MAAALVGERLPPLAAVFSPARFTRAREAVGV
jgi:hypothetical protein